MEQFERYCNPRKNLTFERHSFFSRNQLDGESIDAYVTDLRNKAARCKFGDLKDGLIRDRIVYGINDDTVRARLLREAELTLEGCLDISRAAEISSAQLKVLNEEKTVHVVTDDALNRGDSHKDERGNAKDSKAGMNLCQFCGYRHKRGRCPAYGKTCNACHKPNHFASVCQYASSEGLGACLLQGNQPVAYASRVLNNAERNYAQIEKEMLAIVFGTSKFRQYIYGKTVMVESDHKPLESLFKKPLSMAPQRIQQMMLRVQQYDLIVKYTPGLVTNCTLQIPLAVLVSPNLHHRRMSLKSICLYKFQKKSLMSLREKLTVIQCYPN